MLFNITAEDKKDEAAIKELEYESLGENKCYTHYFHWNEKVYCYDATDDDGTYGRLINHSKLNPNIISKVEVIHGIPYVYFKALDFIPSGTQLLYDYGDRKAKLGWLQL